MSTNFLLFLLTAFLFYYILKGIGVKAHEIYNKNYVTNYKSPYVHLL